MLAGATTRLRPAAARLIQRGAGAVLALLAIGNIALWHPYSIAAFNQLLGGAPMGVRSLSAGWGEGFNLVADWLNQQEDITDVLTVSRMITSLNPYLKAGAQAFFPREETGELRRNAGYLVVYLSEVQGGAPLPPSDRFYGKVPPLHVVTIHGVDYAWIYAVPPDVSLKPTPSPVQFGTRLELHGCNSKPALDQLGPATRLTLTCHWLVRAPLPHDAWLFVHVVDEQGQRVAQLDLPYPTSTWHVGRYVPLEIPLELPTQTGAYRILIGWYDPTTGQRLPLVGGTPADPALSGNDALVLAEVQVR